MAHLSFAHLRKSRSNIVEPVLLAKESIRHCPVTQTDGTYAPPNDSRPITLGRCKDEVETAVHAAAGEDKDGERLLERVPLGCAKCVWGVEGGEVCTWLAGVRWVGEGGAYA
jgi:hypothetical protein